jgi:hypothetical protein
MVFGITFALNYLGRPTGTSGPNPIPPPPPARTLRFAKTTYPENEKEPPLESERNEKGHHDFWFLNDNEEELLVGLKSRNCRCSSVEMQVMPPEWKQYFLKLAEAKKQASITDQLRFASEVDDPQLRKLEGKGEGVVVETPSGTFGKVPAESFGRIRLRWKREQPGPETLLVKLWTDQADNDSANLSLRVMILDPLQTRPTWEVGNVLARDLPTKDIEILCWSGTRTSIKLKADRGSSHQPASSDPFVVGEPIPMTEEQKTKLAQAAGMRRVLCGYRIPITLRAVSEDGTMPFELGPFRRWVVFTGSEEDGIEPVKTAVTGRVEGEVTVGNPSDIGVISFGVFEGQKGAKRTVVLQSSVPGLEMKLDPDHKVPDYLKVDKFSDKAEVGPGGSRTWKLQVEVVPGRAHGVFPRDDDPTYRDSAIYLKTLEKTPRTIRVPVSGTANDF